ncbi:MAG: cyclic peptide export ABC transporter [Thermodesulfobacteriota bacterium]|nr:cyclic peptide export ABC transporter [Thermodesulfobacteriota bacterium]
MKSSFLTLLRRESGTSGVKIVTVATASGLLQGLVVVIINGAAETLSEGGLNFRYLLLFAVCITGFILAKKYALSRSIDLIQNIIFNIRVKMADKIRRSSLIHIEGMGKARIYTTLAENTETIFEATKRVANASSAAVMLTFSFGYIWVLSHIAFFLSVVLISIGISIYLFTQKKSNRDLRISMEKETEFFGYLDHLLDGFKEVKINSERSDDLFENYLKEVSLAARHLRLRTEFRFIDNYVFSQTFFYMLMASIIFLLPQISTTEPGVIVNVVAVVLFVIGPLGDIVEAMPLLARADVSVQTLERLENQLEAADDTRETLPSSRIQRVKAFDHISYNGVSFSYDNNDTARQFRLGPLDLSVHSGEVLFLVGGNGSGKSTLLKILTGLYYPQAGQVMLDDVDVNMTNYAHFRNLFSIIFTDFHLFDRLYGLEEVDEETLRELLDTMQISDKTGFAHGRFTNINLSTGQKKRLALIASYLENKPIFVFDEVAADQDPEFRRYFYEVLLKDLKEQGKTIIAASHDDRYFHVADRVLKMEFGQFMDM